MISAIQARMARAAVGWKVREVAARARVAANTVLHLEKKGTGHAATKEQIQRAYEAAGVRFVPDGVIVSPALG